MQVLSQRQLLTRSGTSIVELLIATLCALGLTSCADEDGRVSVLLISLDTTRADRLGCYGWDQAGTPTLDALASRGARFDSAHTTAPITLPAHSSLLTGTRPTWHGVRDNGAYALGEELETWAERMQAEGYATMASVAAFPLDPRFGLEQGFEHYAYPPAGEGEHDGAVFAERDGAEVTREALAWLEARDPDQPFFLWAHYFDPHWPFAPPAEYAARFEGDAYQGELAWTDACIADLLDALPEDVLVVVVGDHGEGLGDRGEESHSFLLYASTTRVPLLMAGPGVPEGRVVTSAASIIDVLPTVFELVDLAPPYEVQGRSLVEDIRVGTALEGEAYMETLAPRLHCGWSELRALVAGPWKLVVASDAHTQPELYALEEDPEELVDVSAAHPALTEELHARLEVLLLEEQEGYAARAMRSLDASEEQLLGDLGYATGVLMSASDPERVLPHPADRTGLLALVLSANAWIREGELALAAEQLDEARAIDPDDYLLRRELGYFALVRGREQPALLEEALAHYSFVLAQQPADDNLMLEVAEVHLLREEFAACLVWMRQASELRVDDPELRARQAEVFGQAKLHARALEAQGELADCAELWEFLVEYAPEAPGPRVQLARLRAASGNE